MLHASPWNIFDWNPCEIKIFPVWNTVSWLFYIYIILYILDRTGGAHKTENNTTKVCTKVFSNNRQKSSPSSTMKKLCKQTMRGEGLRQNQNSDWEIIQIKTTYTERALISCDFKHVLVFGSTCQSEAVCFAFLPLRSYDVGCSFRWRHWRLECRRR